MSYERLFRSNIRLLIEAYAAVSPIKSPSTIGRVLFADPGILRMAEDDDKKFGVHIYDRIVATFHANWPQGAVWPEGIDPVDLADVRAPVARGAGERGDKPSSRTTLKSLQDQLVDLRAQLGQP